MYKNPYIILIDECGFISPISDQHQRTLTTTTYGIPLMHLTKSAAVQQSIDKLNDEAKCFYYVLDRIISGKQRKDTGVNYEWYMKVNRIYDEGKPTCLGECADDCSGVETYLVSAHVSSRDDEEPQILKLHRTPL
ncbi:unnamed protein product [Mesocestoides corti]|uniref:Zonular occludens toxin n=1 Tax=Mesocestoides corti TaxID=53468 RepID=A0A0R3UN05_MESCO|nr:unnamed protein product [Mesocestoides corti]